MDFDTFPAGKATYCPTCGQQTGYEPSIQERMATLLKPGIRKMCMEKGVVFDEKKFYALIGSEKLDFFWEIADFDAISKALVQTMTDG